MEAEPLVDRGPHSLLSQTLQDTREKTYLGKNHSLQHYNF